MLNNYAVSEWEELLSLLKPDVFLNFTSISHNNVGGKYSLRLIFQFKLETLCGSGILLPSRTNHFIFTWCWLHRVVEKTQQERFIYKMGDNMTCGHNGGGDIGTYWESRFETYLLPYIKLDNLWKFDAWCRELKSGALWQLEGMRWEVGERFQKVGTYVYIWLIHVNV